MVEVPTASCTDWTGKISLGVVSDAVIAGYEQDLPDTFPAATDLVAVEPPAGKDGGRRGLYLAWRNRLASLSGERVMNTTDRPDPKIAFVFEGGGSLAATQIGMLRALTEARLRPQLVIGTSAGAINAAAYAADPTSGGIAHLAALWRSLHHRDIAKLPVLLREHFADQRLEDGQLPAHVVTTDVASGTAHVISAGPVVEALLASAAVPGVFPPVTIDGRRLVDGAAAANTPIRQAQQLGATDVYVLTVATPTPTGDRTTAPDTAPATLRNMLDVQTARHPQSPLGRVHLLPGPPSPTGNILDFRHSDQLIGDSYHLTRQWLAEVQPGATAA